MLPLPIWLSSKTIRVDQFTFISETVL
jgi:hypothetical protein